MKIRLVVVLATLIATVFIAADRVIGQAGGEETLMHVRLLTPNPAALERQLEREGYDVLHAHAPFALELVVSREELEELSRRGLIVQIIERGRPLQEILRQRQEFQIEAVPSGYRDLNGVYARMQEIAAANPAIARFIDITATHGTPVTAEGRHLFALKISDNVAQDEDEPAMLIVSNHHAREIITPVIALDAAERLTNGYGSDARITAIVNENEIWIAPVWNPDGYHYVFTTDNLWRKNRRVFTGGVGVDQNRNYPQGWTASCSGSTSPSSDTYKGPSAGSEAETRTMMTWSRAVRFAKVLDFHSFARDVRYGYNCSTHPFQGFFQQEAAALGQAANYTNSVSVAEGGHPQWQFSQMSALTALLETGTAFQPAFSSAVSEAARVWPAILRMLERPIPLSGRVTDAATGTPIGARLEFLNVNFQHGETYTSGGAFGAYQFFGPSGSYNIRFSAPGYQSQTRTVSVNAASAAVLNVQLSAATTTDVFSDDFETNKGWVVNPGATDTATAGQWERGDPEATNSGGAKQLGTTTSGVNALVTGRLAGASAGTHDVDGGVTSIQSPAIVLPSGNLTLSFNFYLAHATNASNADFFRVRVVGGTTQTVFERRGAATNVNAVWTPTSASLNAFAGQTVRIVIDVADNAEGSLLEAAVDDLRITRQ